MAVKISLLVFWVLTTCGLVGRYQSSSETFVCFYKTRIEAGMLTAWPRHCICNEYLQAHQ
jgi:hypothetical protein